MPTPGATRTSRHCSTAAIGLMFSGGLDSAVLLGRLLARGEQVQPFYIRAGSRWDDSERTAASRYCEAIRSPRLADLIEFRVPTEDLYGSDHWSIAGRDVPADDSPDEAVYLPGRNALLLLKPAIWCARHGVPRLALGTLQNNPFADATPVFARSFQTLIELTTGKRVEIVQPLNGSSKAQTVQLGSDLPLGLTFSCLAPVAGRHCGRCNKCAERAVALAAWDQPDPTDYAQPLLRPIF